MTKENSTSTRAANNLTRNKIHSKVNGIYIADNTWPTSRTASPVALHSTSVNLMNKFQSLFLRLLLYFLTRFVSSQKITKPLGISSSCGRDASTRVYFRKFMFSYSPIFALRFCSGIFHTFFPCSLRTLEYFQYLSFWDKRGSAAYQIIHRIKYRILLFYRT